MSFRDCIVSAKTQGLLDDQKQLDLLNEYDETYKKYIDEGMGSEGAAKQAGLDTFNQMKVDAAQKIKERKHMIRRQENFEFQLARYTDQKGEIDYGSVIKQHMMKWENPEGVNRIQSVEEVIEVVQGRLNSINSEVLKKFRHGFLGGVRNKATLVTMGREIFNPGSTGNKAAEELARAWIETAETARRMFNDAGGRIPKLENWHLPQSHNELVIRDAGYKAWRNFLLENDLLDLDQMIDYRTGKKMSPEQLEIALTDVYNTISTFGYSKKTKVKAYSSKLSNRRLDHRFIKFKDYDSWDAYNKKFGKGNAFDAMVGHIKNMSRDIAMMRVLSPDPDKFIAWMKFTAEKKLVTDTPNLTTKQLKKKLDKLKSDMVKVDDAYRTINGDLLDPGNHQFARSMGGLRDLTTAMYLGAASFMALGDFNLTRITARVHGLPAAKTMFRNAKIFMNGWRQDKSTGIKVAASSGMVAEHWGTIASGLARVSSDDIERPEVTRRVADFILRTSGLSWLTQAGRWGVGMETMAFFARNANLTWDQLGKKNAKFKQLLETNNINSGEWDIIRRIPIYDAGVDDALNKGAEFLRPSDIFKLEDLTEEQAMDVFSKFQGTINYIIDFAVPASTLRGSLVAGGARPGTVQGEFVKSFLQFKQFPLAFMFGHITKGMGRKGAFKKAGYLTDLIISTTIMGALAYEMKQIAKGKEPTPITELNKDQYASYVLGNLLRGGGLGFMGDFLFSTQYGGAKGGAGTILGSIPMLGLEILDFTFGNALRTIKGKDVNYGGDLADLIKKNFPGGSLWYARLALERWVFDNISKFIDPKYYKKRKRLIKRVRKEEGTEFFWSPGDNLPSKYPF
jgi:hypothetical protein|tara:strand:- start:3508 stop:6057 length:2550 start_codon:yes stop_codon:yes gene_type:complete